MLTTGVKNALKLTSRNGFQMRFTSGIKLLNERAKADEDYYFSKQDGKFRRFDP